MKKFLKLTCCLLLGAGYATAEEYLAGSDGRTLLRPAPAGANQWEPLPVGAGGQNLRLTFDPVDPDRIYLAVDVCGVVKTIDGGEHWINSVVGLQGLAGGNYPAGDIAVDPENPEVLYASWGREYKEPSGIIRSTDRGESWTMISQEVCGYGEGAASRKGGGGPGLLLDPRDSKRLYVIDNKHNGGAGGLWISSDGGVTWRPSGLTGRKLHTVRFAPDNPDVLYASGINRGESVGGFWVSTDRGETWQARGLEGEDVFLFDFSPADPRTIYAVTGLNGFQRSDDGGISWRECNAGLPLARDGKKGKFFEYRYRALAVDPFRPGHLIIGADVIRAYYESFDGGATWTLLPARGVGPAGWMLSGDHMGWHTNMIYFHPLRKDTLFLCDYFGTWKSTDGGRNWRINPYGQESSCMVTVLPDRTEPGRLYLGIWDHFMLIVRKQNGRETVERETGLFRRGPTNKHLSGVTQFGLEPDRMVAVTNSSTPFVSADRGKSWRESATGLPDELMYRVGVPLALDRKNVVFLPVNGKAEQGGGLYRSDDFGMSWKRTGNAGLDPAGVEVCGQWDPRQNVLAATPDGGTVLFASAGKRYSSADLGETWRPLPVPDRVLTAGIAGDGALLAGTFSRGLMISRDGGTTWQSGGTAAGRVRLIASDGRRLLVHTAVQRPDRRIDYHLDYSPDGGSSWQGLLNRSLPVWNLQGIAFDPFDPAMIYANTYWCGSWRTRLRNR